MNTVFVSRMFIIHVYRQFRVRFCKKDNQNANKDQELIQIAHNIKHDVNVGII